MEIYLVNPNRMNVFLTDAELLENSIDIHNLCDENNRLQCSLRRLLEEASETLDFKLYNTALEMEIFPVAEGNLLISLYRAPKTEQYCVCFLDIEAVIACCKCLYSVFTGESALYRFQNKYYLHINHISCPQILSVLTEFAHQTENNPNLSVLQEHGKVICEQNCVQVLNNWFKN